MLPGDLLSGVTGSMKTIIISLLAIASALCVVGCGLLYIKQEALLFYPAKLPASYQFRFPGAYREYPISAPDGTRLSGLLFRALAPKGLVFFLHGNGALLNPACPEFGQVRLATESEPFIFDEYLRQE